MGELTRAESVIGAEVQTNEKKYMDGLGSNVHLVGAAQARPNSIETRRKSNNTETGSQYVGASTNLMWNGVCMCVDSFNQCPYCHDIDEAEYDAKKDYKI